MVAVDDVLGAREANERRMWVSEYRTLSSLDEPDLGAGGFAALATTAYLLGQRNDCIQALQRAPRPTLTGEVLGAVRLALWPATMFRCENL
jgi:hypothetical protein